MVGKDAADELFEVVERTGASHREDEVDGDVEVVLRVHVHPGAGRTAVVGRHGDALKVRVAAAPEGGRANDLVAELLATTFGLAAGEIELESGASSRSKRFRIGPIDLNTLRRLLVGATRGDSTPKKGGGAATGNAKGLRGVR